MYHPPRKNDAVASSGSQAAVGLFRWIGRSPRLINDKIVPIRNWTKFYDGVKINDAIKLKYLDTFMLWWALVKIIFM